MDAFNTSVNKNSDSREISEVDDGFSNNKTLEIFTTAGFKMLNETIRKSNKLPFGKTRDLYESYPSFHSLMGNQSENVLSTLSMLMKHSNSKSNIQRRDDEDKFEMIVDANDALLENVGISLDELSGIKRNPEAQLISQKLHTFNGSWNKNKINNSKAATQVLSEILNKTKNIEKPQLSFKDVVNNDSNIPFEPRINYKYNLLKPLALIEEINENGVCQFSHPYEFELTKFKPLNEQLTHHSPKPYKSLEETSFFFITKLEDVANMVEDLEKYKEIAVDLEYHSYRSFQGFTCLMQISTRDTDYVVDTLKLRSELQPLNKVFTDPSVVKVFHGADSDILWLQKDLALYVVNMFDTHQAAKLLSFPKLSLAYLLSYYCNVDAQKHFQLADWRIRPLPQELLNYAREDTHYLLYIYDNLRNTLIEKANGQTNLLESVISESTRVCLKRYIKPIYESDGYLDIYNRSKKLFDNRQKFALECLFEWRDKTARTLDESYAYVLPNHMMLNISEILPREAQGILACCNPIPLLIRQNLLVLHQIILKAREQPLIQPVLEEQRFYKYTTSINSLDNPLQCPHDLNHEAEFRDDLPVLFIANSESSTVSGKNLIEKQFLSLKPIVNVFEKTVDTLKKAETTETEKIHLSPYQRYKLAKKFSESVETKNFIKNEKTDLEKSDLNNQKPELTKPSSDESSMSKRTLVKEEIEETNIKISDKDVNVKNHGKNKDKAETSGNKRNIEEEERQVKRVKRDNNSLVINPYHESPVKNEKSSLEEEKTKSKSRKKIKGKKKFFAGKSEKQFQPFDYKSVDFEKYRTAPVQTTKKPEKRRKQNKRSLKKNF